MEEVLDRKKYGCVKEDTFYIVSLDNIEVGFIVEIEVLLLN